MEKEIAEFLYKKSFGFKDDHIIDPKHWSWFSDSFIEQAKGILTIMNKNPKAIYEYCKKDAEMTYDVSCFMQLNNYLFEFEVRRFPIWIKQLYAHLRLRMRYELIHLKNILKNAKVFKK